MTSNYWKVGKIVKVGSRKGTASQTLDRMRRLWTSQMMICHSVKVGGRV